MSKMRRKQRKLVSDFENRHKRLKEELRKTLSRKSLERVKELPEYDEVSYKVLNIMKRLVENPN